MSNSGEISAALETSRSEVARFSADPAFRSRWLGFNGESRDYMAQQVRAFGALLEPVTTSLSGWKILDVGCGDGRWLRRMIDYDANPDDIVGVDINEGRISQGSVKNPKVKLLHVDGFSLPFGDANFDLVTQFVCFSSVPTVKLREHTAREIKRVLKPGGYVFWWDLFRATSPSDREARIEAADYFEWPMRRAAFGRVPRPSEVIRLCQGWSSIAKCIDRLGYRPTHAAALIGPKP